MISIVIPTYNNFEYVYSCLKSIKNSTEDYFVYLIDDNSPQWKSEVENKIRSLVPEGSKIFRFENNDGCTRSWNLGIQLSKKEDITVIANSDVLFSKGWKNDIEVALNEFSLVGPISNAPGGMTKQNIKYWIPDYDVFDGQKQIDQINNDLKIGPFQIEKINGFFMAAKTSDWLSNSFNDTCVFDPKFKLLNNEWELQKRWKGKIGVANCFIFHYKAVSRQISKIPKGILNGIYRKQHLMI